MIEQRLDDIQEENETQAFRDQNQHDFQNHKYRFKKESPTSTKGKYIVKRLAKNIDFSKPKVYMLGNHVLNTTDKITPQQQITTDEYQNKSSDEQKDYMVNCFQMNMELEMM